MVKKIGTALVAALALVGCSATAPPSADMTIGLTYVPDRKSVV